MAAMLIILGATGDLTSRYLLPAIAGLRQLGAWKENVPIVGVGQKDWNSSQFRAHIAEGLSRHASGVADEARRATLESLEYRKANVTDPGELARLIGEGEGPVAVYLALPPGIYADVLKGLAAIDLPEGSRVAIEKPFGTNLASAKQLNGLIRPAFDEKEVFRIDHFLGIQTAQNVLGLRFGNRVFEELWNRDQIERVEITWDETVALEGRAKYYDHAGALKDMVQNHLLQLLCLVAMEAPSSFEEREFRDRKVEVLKAVRRPSEEEVATETVRARYMAGQVAGKGVPNYVDEEGVDASRGTETFTSVTLHVDNARWGGVPFVLRTGKAMRRDRHEVVVRFRPVPHWAFREEAPEPNVLRLGLDPDRLEMGVNINGLKGPFELERACMDIELAPQKVTAYGRVLLDILEGESTLSIRGDEAEESWRIVEPILGGWGAGLVPMREYEAGGDGP